MPPHPALRRDSAWRSRSWGCPPARPRSRRPTGRRSAPAPRAGRGGRGSRGRSRPGRSGHQPAELRRLRRRADVAATLAGRSSTSATARRSRAGTLRLVVEVFAERGIEGRLGTWRVDVSPGTPRPAIRGVSRPVSRLSVVTGLYRLSLNTATEYDIHNLVVRAPDLALEMASGRAFVAETPDGPTALVLLGRGRMRFTPPDAAERTQIRIFARRRRARRRHRHGLPAVLAGRVRVPVQSGVAPPAARSAASDLRTAPTSSTSSSGGRLQIDLSDISRDRWSLTPTFGDLIAELRTRKFGLLTYARSGSEAEDITVFDRRRRRNISLYTSAAKLAQRGALLLRGRAARLRRAGVRHRRCSSIRIASGLTARHG